VNLLRFEVGHRSAPPRRVKLEDKFELIGGGATAFGNFACCRHDQGGATRHFPSDLTSHVCCGS
jgi:hypothetical protein